MLESQGVVTIKNDYQDIINAIAKVTFLILFNLTTHTLEMWFVVMLNTVAISLSSKVISFYWFCCLLDYVTDETKPLGNWVTNRAQIIQSVTQAISQCVSVSYLVSCYRTSAIRGDTVKGGDKKKRNLDKLWKACRTNRSSMRNKSTTIISTFGCA